MKAAPFEELLRRQAGQRMKPSNLLVCDAIINLVLGVLLVVFPESLVTALGIPPAEVAFYPSLLGAVLFGVGVALLIERFRGSSGLGLCGAISINLSGGLVLSAWLIFGSLSLPARGQAVLWALVAVLVGISALEGASQARAQSERGA